jgi:FkbM family methyltransferase
LKFIFPSYLASPYFVKPEYRGVVALSVAKGLMVDVGANRGQSIPAFKNLAPESNIVALEPEPKSAERLALRYRRDPTVTIHGCALGERATTVTFFVPTYGRWDCDGMSATGRKEQLNGCAIPGRMLLFNEAKLTVKEHQIECRTLDSYKLAPLLIKLHAQGDEFAILKGSKQTIRQHKPALMCAFPSVAVTELLSDWGYRPYAYYKDALSPG